MNNLNNRKRIAFYDIARSFCMIWIVSFWHLFDSIRAIPKIPRGLESLTIASLATFVFISGFFMGAKHEEDALTFYKLRLRRFYLLFAISCVTLWIISHYGLFRFIDGKQLVLTLIGISCLFDPPYTLWFFSMMIYFYALTPIFNSRAINKNFKICIFFVIYIVLLSTTMYFHLDKRLLLYFPVYILGLNIKYIYKDFYSDYFLVLIYCMVFGLGFCLFIKYRNNHLVNSIIALGAPFLVLSICYFISQKFSFLNEVFHKIGYASMCMYLFHRQLFYFMDDIQNYMTPIFTYLVMMVSLFVLSYSVQYIYDLIIRNWIVKS